MSDLIDRQAVLELPRNVTRTLFGDIVEQSIDVERIKALPSAEPEIIRCKDCKNYNPLGKDDAWGDCDQNYHIWCANDFCSWAERRSDE